MSLYLSRGGAICGDAMCIFIGELCCVPCMCAVMPFECTLKCYGRSASYRIPIK